MAREIVARYPQARELLRGDDSPHLGLVFERFPRVLDKAGGGFRLPEGARREWLDELIELARETPARKARLAHVHARLDRVMRAFDGRRRDFETAWRFAIGLGNPNVAEIGFSFDVACGVPALPGSAVKGLVRAGAQLCEATSAEEARILGKGHAEYDPGNAGAVIFLEALPVRWPKLEVDIITRHHDAEALSNQQRPLDTDEPNPLHFLTVAPDQVFSFRLLARPGAPEDALPLAWTWLERALDDLGAGAKTAVGYGQMLPV